MAATDEIRTLITEAAEYAGPEDDTSAALWRAINAAERAIADLAADMRAVDEVHDILWPSDDPEQQWSPDTIEAVASVVRGVRAA